MRRIQDDWGARVIDCGLAQQARGTIAMAVMGMTRRSVRVATAGECRGGRAREEHGEVGGEEKCEDESWEWGV
eukprot:4739397-Pyramimonas_sp.AAC.1